MSDSRNKPLLGMPGPGPKSLVLPLLAGLCLMIPASGKSGHPSGRAHFDPLRAAIGTGALLSHPGGQLPGTPELSAGPGIESRIQAGSSREYLVRLKAGQYAHVQIEMPDTPVSVTVCSPAGKEVEGRFFWRFGPSRFSLIAESSGLHRLILRSLEPQDATFPLVLIRINMATYLYCLFRRFRLPFHPGRMNQGAENKPISHQFVSAGKTGSGKSGAKIHVAILCRPSRPDDSPGRRGLVQ